MKTLKRIFAIAMVLCMVAALGVPAFAANDFTITIKNPTIGATYTAYKVFDAEYDGTNSITYYYKGSHWDNDTAVNDTFDYNTTTKVVTLKSGKSTTNLGTLAVSYLGKLVKDDSIAAAATKTVVSTDLNTDKTLTLTVTDPGYYYVKATVGSGTAQKAAVSVSTLSPNADIIDKIPTEPGPGPDGYKTVKSGDTWSTSTNAKYGETLNFKINFNAVNYIVKTDSSNNTTATSVYNYIITDEPTGLSNFNITSIKVGDTEIGQFTGEGANKKLTAEVADVYTYDAANHKLTLTWATSTGTGSSKVYTPKYSSASTVTILYTATVSQVNGQFAGIQNANVAAQNTATFTYNDGTAFPDNPNPPVKVYSYNLTVNTQVKTNDDPETFSPIAGADYSLGDMKFVYVSDGSGYYRPATEAESGKTLAQISDDGTNMPATFVIKGLANGEYAVNMDTAPTGYNVPVTSKQTATIDNKNAELTFTVLKGTPLPTTGGMGTTLFYVLGSILVLGAIVLFVTKKRVDANN